GARARLADRLFGRDRDGVRVAGHGQADHRLDPAARSARGRRLPHDHRLHVRDHQSRGGRALFAARPPRSAPGHQGMSPADTKMADVSTGMPPERASPAPPVETPFRRFLSSYTESPVAVVAFVALVLILLI